MLKIKTQAETFFLKYFSGGTVRLQNRPISFAKWIVALTALMRAL